MSLFLQGCCGSKKKKQELIFPVESKISHRTNISKEDLAQITMMTCFDSILVIEDMYLGQLYSGFNLITPESKYRFGTIGQAPNELSRSCYGYSKDENLQLYDPNAGFVGYYNIHKLIHSNDTSIHRLYKKPMDFQITFYNRVMSLDNLSFLGVGLTYENYQYVLFDENGSILDKAVKVYNADDEKFNRNQRILSTSGELLKRKGRNEFVYMLRRSSNIDFLKIEENKIVPVNLQREKDPQLKSFERGGNTFVVPKENSQVGYVWITGDDSFVYALHSTRTDQNYCSNTIRVFDWTGNPIKQLVLDHEVYYIAANTLLSRLYAAVKDEDGGWDIIYYDI